MRACAAEAGEESCPPGRRAGRGAGQGVQPILSLDGYRHHRDDPERDSAKESRQYQVRYRCCAAVHDSLPTQPAGGAGYRRVVQLAVPESPRRPDARVINRPERCSYHLACWTGTTHWAGMTCTPMTKQPNDRTITDGSGDPNVWYMSGLIPLAIDLKTPLR